MTDNRLHDDESVHGYVGRVCFKTGPPHHVGVELEQLVAPAAHPCDPVLPDSLTDLLRDAASMPGGSRVTLEPGGQVELSSPVADDLTGCWHDLGHDTARLDHLLARHELTVLPVALDPQRPPRRVLHTPRYDAMQDYFDRVDDTGLLMMTSTAALQVNLDAGADPDDVARRWDLLYGLGPVLVATFANSPVHAGRVSGWKSTRQRLLLTLDRARMAPPVGPDPASAWAAYALDAPVMLCRRAGTWLASPGFSFREWVAGAGPHPPTEDDLAYHLTTLFPPVRPRGWLEVRYVDAQPPGLWPVPLAVLTALTNDPGAADLAREAADPVRDRWGAAGRLGPADPALARASRRCLEAALAALPRLGAAPDLIALVTTFAERYTVRGRCPADDLLDLSSREGSP